MDATRVLAIMAVIGILLTLLTIVGGGGYALAELRASDDRLADRMDRLANTVDRNHRELQLSLGNHYHDEARVMPSSPSRPARSDRHTIITETSETPSIAPATWVALQFRWSNSLVIPAKAGIQ